MGKYTIRRLLASLPVLAGVLVVTFILARSIPGEPCRAILGEKATQEACDRFYVAKGLDKPIWVQFGPRRFRRLDPVQAPGQPDHG